MNFPSILIIIAVGLGVVLAVRYLVAGKGHFGCDHRCDKCTFAQKCAEVNQTDQSKKETNCLK